MPLSPTKAAALAGIALSAVALALAPSVATAACCVAYDYNDASNNKNQVISQLTDRINAMQLAVIEATRLGTGQLSGNLKEQIGANSNVANVQDDRNVAGRVEQARLGAISSAASGSSSCNVITGANAMSTMPASVRQLSQTMTQSLVAWDNGTDPQLPSYQGQDVAVEARVQLHCGSYATSDDVNAGLCPTASSQNPGGDVDISRSLFYAGANSDDQTLDAAHLAATKAFLVNAMDPRPQGGSLAGGAGQLGGRQKAGDREANSARLSVGFDTVSDLTARRAALSTTAANGWATAMAQQTNQKLSPVNMSNTSFDTLMGVRAKGWFFNTVWAVGADGQGEGQVIKDMAMMMSFQVYLQWEQYHVQEKTNLLLAQILAINVQASRSAHGSTPQ